MPKLVTFRKKPKYTVVGVKALDAFFCLRDFPSFKKAFPSADTADFFVLQGENAWAKQKLFQSLIKTAAASRVPCTRVLCAHSAVKTAAVYLEQPHRFAVDGDYFSSLPQLQRASTKRYTVASLPQRTRNADKELQDLREQAQRAHAHAAVFLQDAARIQQDITEQLSTCVDRARAVRAVLSIANAAVSAADASHSLCAYSRCLTGVTAWGVHTFYAPFLKKGMRTAIIRDAFGGVSPILLSGLCTAFEASGLQVQKYLCPLTGVPTHLVIPQCNVAFFTENDLHPFPFAAHGVLRASRFIERDALHALLPAIKAQKYDGEQALASAVFSLYEADEAHRAILQFAAGHTDRDALACTQQLFLSDFFDFRHFTEK